MQKFGPIVGIVNSWESCAPVVRRTAELASRLSAPASITVLPDSAPSPWSPRRQQRASVEVRVRQLVAEMTDVHGVEIEVSSPGPDVDVVQRVHDASRHAGLLVVNLTPPMLMPRSIFLARLLAGARCPVLVPKTLFPARYEKVLVPVDFSGRSEVAVEWASKMAPEGRARLLHMLRPKDEQAMEALDVPHWVIRDVWSARVGRARAALETLSRRAPSQQLRSVNVRRGIRVRDAVLAEQAETKADLVVASMNATDPLSLFLGRSLAVRLASSAPCDVLALPPKFLPRPRRLAEAVERRRIKAGVAAEPGGVR